MIGLRLAGSLPLPGSGRRRRRLSHVATLGAPVPNDNPAVEVVAEQRLARPPAGSQRPPATRRRWWLIVGLLLVITLLAVAGLTVLVWQRTAPQPIVEGQPFHPTASAWVRGGSYRVPSVDIPADVTITAAGDLELIVSGQTRIDGRLAGDCAAISILSDGGVAVSGSIDNACSSADAAGRNKDLVIQSRDGALTLGSAEATARLHTTGVLEVSGGAAPEGWHFDVLPAERTAEPVPPVCRIQADTVTGLVLPGMGRPGTRTVFAGAGADPDGGPVTYAWDFGDGGASEELGPEHSYAAPGAYDVVLDVVDDEGQTCRATARVVVDDGTAGAGGPGVWAAPSRLVVPTAVEASFSARALAPDGAPVAYRWDFGDGGTSDEAQPVHRYHTAGRYDVTLTASAGGDPVITSTAVASIQVYDPAAPQSSPATPRPVSKNRVDGTAAAIRFRYDGDVVFLPGSRWTTLPPQPRPADPRDGELPVLTGGDIELYATGNMAFPAGTGDTVVSTLVAAAGAAGTDSPGWGGDGGPGGAIVVVAEGDIVIGSRAAFAAGDGGAGGTPAGGVSVVGGAGGRGGSLTLRAGGHLTIDGGVSLSSGSGGAGGGANAPSDTGVRAYAHAGSGGAAGYVTIDGVHGLNFGSEPGSTDSGENPVLSGEVIVAFGLGGPGGAASATGASGASSCPRGRDGDAATARGGHGGNGAAGWSPVRLGCQVGVTTRGGNGGPGGAATAIGGDGGNAGSGSAPCTSAATGGDGGAATAVGGSGAPSGARDLNACSGLFVADGVAVLSGGPGGATLAVGGAGGDAVAVGPACSESAKSEGGPGGAAYAHGGSGMRGGDAAAFPGHGGNADARGGDCQPLCGRPGGNAWAIGGSGGAGNAHPGEATGDAHTGVAVAARDTGQDYGMGRGGNASAQGGAGGDCTSHECPAGRGGKGGTASAIGGAGGMLIDAAGRRVAPAGDALAGGGAGGQGAACCDSPAPGGDGAAGGNADASVQPGGVATARGGSGGAGGDGIGPGAGGSGGAPGGQAGTGGRVCIVTPTHTPAPTATPTTSPTPEPTSTPVPLTATATSGPTTTATSLPTETPAPTEAPALQATPTPVPVTTYDSPTPTPPAIPATAMPTSQPPVPAGVVDTGPTGVFYLAYYAAGRTAMDDLRVRQALTQMIDRAAVVSLAGAPGARLAEGLIPVWQYPDPAARMALGYPGLPYDPPAASALEAEVRSMPGLSGWPEEIILAAPQSERAVAEAIAAAWEVSGARVQRQYFDPQPDESPEMPRYRDWLRQQRPHAYLRAWRADGALDVFLIELLEDTPLRWSSEEARAHLQAVEAAGRGSDGRAVADIVFEVEQSLIKDAVLYVPLYYYDLRPE